MRYSKRLDLMSDEALRREQINQMELSAKYATRSFRLIVLSMSLLILSMLIRVGFVIWG